MSSSRTPQPDPRGSFSRENAPQVVVRAGKTFLCTACGTLVEVPADVVGQLAWVVQPAAQERPADEPVDEPVAELIEKRVPAKVTVRAQESRKPRASQERTSSSDWWQPTGKLRDLGEKMSRPRKPQRPPRQPFAGQLIDGLRVPTARELDGALAWVTFHLTVLDRQGSEINRLQKLLKRPAAQPPSQEDRKRGQARKASAPLPVGSVTPEKQEPAPDALGMAPDARQQLDRGPP